MPPRHAKDVGGHNTRWCEWLEEWKSEAEIRGSHETFNLNKALKSLRQCTEPISHPDDLRAVPNFGPITIRRIKDRCREEDLQIHRGMHFVISYTMLIFLRFWRSHNTDSRYIQPNSAPNTNKRPFIRRGND